ncbi:MAG: acyl-CoA dehydrogenase N-terminal domain-containing protein, partial [Gammaproteobacteria bacterium]|nr:acyl-CoA dehydrogenase N-terminal domain-containing protein [Gammaproteobacteria bacterium]
MTSYTTPLRDLLFVYSELLNPAVIQALPGYEEVTPELVESILAEAGKFCEEQLFPLNRSGDEEGCRFEQGRVFTPEGFKAAYAAFTEAGWTT